MGLNLAELNQNLEQVIIDLNESYKNVLNNINGIENDDNNLDTKLLLIKSSLKNILDMSKMSFNMIVAVSKLQQTIIENITEHNQQEDES